MVTEAEPFHVTTINGWKITPMMVESQVVLLVDPHGQPINSLVFTADEAEQLGRALWDLGREE